MKTKVCNKCGEEKALEEFYKQKLGKYGRKAQCKACEKAYYEANREAVLAHKKAYYEANRDEKLTKQRAYRQANREEILAKQKAYYEATKEERIAKQKVYRDNNRDRLAAKQRAYYEATKEERLAKQRAYYEANRDERIAKQKVYREANKGKYNEYYKAYYEANREAKLAKQKEYHKKRYAEDPVYRTKHALRTQTSRLGDYKNKKTIQIVGISAEEFWRRNGSPTEEELRDLHIDHIVPLSWFDLSNEDHVTVSSHWTNFQYLTTEENLMKGNRYAGTPRAILGTKDDFDIEKHVQDMIEFINATK